MYSILYYCGLGFLILSGVLDFYTGKLCSRFKNTYETNPFGEVVGSFGNVIIIGAITLIIYLMEEVKSVYIMLLLILPCIGFAVWHIYAAWRNYSLYKRLKG